MDRDRDRDREIRDGREFMSEDEYRRRFDRDRERGELSRWFRDEDDRDENRYGHPSLREDYNRDRDWVRDEAMRRGDRSRFQMRDDDRYSGYGGHYGRGNRDEDRYDYGRRMSRDDDYRERGRYDRDYERRSESRGGYGERSRYDQRERDDYGRGYGNYYGDYGSSHRGGYYGREDEPRRYTSDRDERDREQYGQREWMGRGRGRDDDRRR